MSWELASFVILLAVLLAGFAWYERSRPPAQVLALVAAMAALAIAGRIAFAAFPNVKPTTDIVIFAGFALGGPAGFAVGALTALVSNFWFGQGPWTPWQMAGWGMCGLLGAALARAGREPNRFVLAAVCGFAGIAYGALLNFSLMATYGGDLTLDHFLLLESRAVPFDVAHAVANITLALVAGPAMIRMLTRFRERFEWRTARERARRAPRGPASKAGAAGVAVLLALVLAAATLPASAGASPSQAAGWLVGQQNSDGGFGESSGDSSNTTTTSWAMLGLEAVGRNPLDIERGGNSSVDYLRRNVGELSSAGNLALAILALHSAGVDPRSFGDRDLVSALLKKRRSDGSYENWPGTTSYAILALRAVGAGGGLAESQSWLGNAQANDGSWGIGPKKGGDADVTGAAMQAIPGSNAAGRGLKYLKSNQRGNGGFGTGSGATNSQSAAWAAQGMLAVGADPASITKDGDSALDYIAALQADDGHYRYSSTSDQTPVWVTGQVLVTTAGDFLPLPVAPRAPQAPPPPPSPNISPNDFTPVPVPGGTPSAPAPTIPESSPSGASPSGGGGVQHAGPLVPEGGAIPPASTTPALPGNEFETGAPLTEAAPASSVSPDAGDPASPWIPIGIGAGVGLLALAVPLLLGRRYAW